MRQENVTTVQLYTEMYFIYGHSHELSVPFYSNVLLLFWLMTGFAPPETVGSIDWLHSRGRLPSFSRCPRWRSSACGGRCVRVVSTARHHFDRLGPPKFMSSGSRLPYLSFRLRCSAFSTHASASPSGAIAALQVASRHVNQAAVTVDRTIKANLVSVTAKGSSTKRRQVPPGLRDRFDDRRWCPDASRVCSDGRRC